MITCKKLSLDDVKAVAAAAEAEAVRRGLAMCIAIYDDAGHMLWFQRMDGAALISVDVAQAKARLAAMGRRPTKVFQTVIDTGMPSLSGMPVMRGALEGGVPVVVAGEVVGGIAASGGSGEEDAAVASAGAAVLAS